MINSTTLSAYLLYSEDTKIRRYVPDKFGKMGDHIPLKALGNVLRNRSDVEIVRIECAEAIGKIGSGIDFLIGYYDDPVDEVRRTVLWSLGQLGEIECLDEIEKYFEDEYWMCQKWIPKSLGRIDHPPSNEILQRFSTRVRDDRILTEIFRCLVAWSYSYPLKYWREYTEEVMRRDDMDFVLKQAVLRFIAHILPIQPWPEAVTFAKEVFKHRSAVEQKEAIPVLAFEPNILLDLYNRSTNREVRTVLAYHMGKANIIPETEDSGELISVVKGLFDSDDPPLDVVRELLQDIPQGNEKKILLLKLELMKGISLAKVFEYYSLPLYRSTVLRSLPMSKHDYYEFLRTESLTGTKKIRQICVEVLREMVEQGRKEYCPLIREIAQRDKVWHIRRDARTILKRNCDLG